MYQQTPIQNDKLSIDNNLLYETNLNFNFKVVVSSYEVMLDVFKSIDTNFRRFEFPYIIDRNYGKNLGKNEKRFN